MPEEKSTEEAPVSGEAKPASEKASRRSSSAVILGAGGLLVWAGLAALMLEAKQRADEAHEVSSRIRKDAETLAEEAALALERAEASKRRRQIADEVFPLPANPFGGPPPSEMGAITAQIPPPPPRMHEIPGSQDLAAAEAEVSGEAEVRMMIPQAAKALELAKIKEADQDVIGALKNLELADQLEPNHPEVLYRMGLLFDKLGNKRRATSHFQMVAAMGDRAGELSTLAIHYLNGEAPENLSGGLMNRPLSIGPAFTEISVDEHGGRTVKLSLSIRAKAGQDIDPQSVVPYIYFYDLVDGLEILPCDGEQPPVDEVNPWRSENPDYKDPEEELLDVTYHIPRIDDGAERDFFGFVVKLYYKDEIQDVLVEPRVLIELLSESEDAVPGTELDPILFEQP